MLLNLWQGYRPHPKQRAFHRNAKRFASLCAGIRGGKSKAASMEAKLRIYRDRLNKDGHLHYWLVAPTYAIGKVQRRMMIDALGGVGGPLISHERISDRELWLHGNICLEYRTANDPGKLIAEGLDGLWFDEPAKAKEDAWHELRGRLSSNAGWGVFSGTPEGENWYYESLVRPAWDVDYSGYSPDTYSCASWHTQDNLYIPNIAAEVESARRTMPEDYFRRYYEADFHSFKGKVFKAFRRETHVIERIPEGAHVLETRYGVDWGTRDPFIVVVLKRCKVEGWEFWALADVVKILDGTEADFVAAAQRVAQAHGQHQFSCDPSAPGYIKAFTRAGLRAKGGRNEVGEGIATVAATMTLINDKPGFVAVQDRGKRHEPMDYAVKSLLNYSWKETESEITEHEWSHVPDAIRYALYTRPHQAAYW